LRVLGQEEQITAPHQYLGDKTWIRILGILQDAGIEFDSRHRVGWTDPLGAFK